MRCGVVAVELRDLRCRLDVRAIPIALGVEHTQRVALERGTRLFAQRVAGRHEVLAQRVDVPGSVIGFAEAVDEQLHLAQAQRPVELPCEGDHLDVEVRVVGAQHLDADLVELAVTPALGLLVPEVRTGVEHLPRRGRAVLGEGPTHARRHLGTQCDVAFTLVDEVVHLLGDHIGGVADAGEHPQILEQRGDQLPVPGPLDHVCEHVGEAAPSTALWRQDVPHAGTGLERGHGRSGYLATARPSPSVPRHPGRCDERDRAYAVASLIGGACAGVR